MFSAYFIARESDVNIINNNFVFAFLNIMSFTFQSCGNWILMQVARNITSRFSEFFRFFPTISPEFVD